MGSPKIGFIGVGLMGGAMATVLLSRGFALKVFDVSPDRVAALVGKGAEAVTSPAEAASNVDILCTSLPNGQIVNDVYLGSGGVMASLAPGAVLVEFSTTEPAVIKSLSAAASARGIDVVDSPISGGPPEVLRQEAIMLVGATDEAFRKAEPVLRMISGAESRVFRLGEAGAGKTVKLVNNAVTYFNVVMGSEAFVAGVKAGIEPERLYEAISVSGGGSHQFVKRIPLALKRDFAARSTISTTIKDLDLALTMGRDLGCPMPITAMVHQLYLAAAAKGFASDDYLAILRLYEEWARIEVGPSVPDRTRNLAFRPGEGGPEKIVELIGNTMVAAGVAAVAEIFIVGVKAGVDPTTLHGILSVCAGRNDPLVKRFPRVLMRDFNPVFSLDSGIENLRHTLAVARETGCPMPITAVVQQLCCVAAAEGHGDEDVVAVIKLFEGWAGVEADGRQPNQGGMR